MKMAESFENFKRIFTDVFNKNGLSRFTGDQTAKKFYDFAVFLAEANEKTNLTAISGAEDTVLKHFADSLIAEEMFPESSTVVDVGCGAGFPSIPLAIVRPDLKITPLDSIGKKIDFVKSAACELGLTNLTPVCARAEEFVAENRETFDVATARAVSRLNVLSELALPLVRVGGLFVAMKAKDGECELDEAKRGIGTLGGSVERVEKVSLTPLFGESLERVSILIEKISATPEKYPRAYAKITKNPL